MRKNDGLMMTTNELKNQQLLHAHQMAVGMNKKALGEQRSFCTHHNEHCLAIRKVQP
jgi:hypothetical protein